MDLLKQCQQWFEQDEAQKVIDAPGSDSRRGAHPRDGQ